MTAAGEFGRYAGVEGSLGLDGGGEGRVSRGEGGQEWGEGQVKRGWEGEVWERKINATLHTFLTRLRRLSQVGWSCDASPFLFV